MAKKHYKLSFLEQFIGKEYIHYEGNTHVRILGIRSLKLSSDTFDTQLDTCSRPLTMPLTNESNGSMNVKYLLPGGMYLPKTKASQVLFAPNKKRGG